MQPAQAPAAAGAEPASKRARVDDVLHTTTGDKQELLRELMGWRASQEPTLPGPSAVAAGARVSGPTDFRTAFARAPSQQIAQPAVAPSAATTGLRTFADVASRQAAGPEDVGRQNVLGVMRAAYSAHIPAAATGLARAASQLAGERTQDGFGQVGGSAAAAAAGLEDLTPEQLPMDWSLKRLMTISSSKRFECHERAQLAPPLARWRAVRHASNCCLDACVTEEEQLLAGQVSWRHPEATLDPAVHAASSTSRPPAGPSASTAAAPGPSLQAQRVAAWRRALQSLYEVYRGGECKMFYILNTFGRSPFAALFVQKGVRGAAEVCAVVSQSTRALRGRLASYGVQFTLPLEQQLAGGRPGAEGAAADDAEDGDLCDKGQQEGPSGAQVPGAGIADNSRQSLLLMRGPRAVHGLYDFLLNETTCATVPAHGPGSRAAGASAGGGAGAEQRDLPLLLSPVPFEGGAVWRPSFKATTVSGKLAGNGQRTDGSAATHVLQLSGPLPPWTVRRMCVALARLHSAGYTASLEADTGSITLNSRVLEQPAADVDAAAGRAAAGGGGGDADGAAQAAKQRPLFPHGGAMTVDELRAWQEPVQLPAGRPAKSIACAAGSRRLAVRL